MASAIGANAALKNKINEASITTTDGKAKAPAQTVADYLKRMSGEIAKALPKHMDANRMARVALTTIRTTPNLLNCKIESLMAAVMQAAQLGLEPGLLGHCYIIPYGKEAQFIIGYKGMIDLARRSGNIESITVEPVYKNDYFKFKRGLSQDEFEHIPWDMRNDQAFDEPGELIRVYLIARFKDGGYYFHRMSKAEIDAHRKRSAAKNSGPWVSDYEEMAKKTVVRSAWKWLPISIDMAKQVESADETVKRDIAEDMSDVIDISAQISSEEVAKDIEGADGISASKAEDVSGQKQPPEREESLIEKHKRITGWLDESSEED